MPKIVWFEVANLPETLIKRQLKTLGIKRIAYLGESKAPNCAQTFYEVYDGGPLLGYQFMVSVSEFSGRTNRADFEKLASDAGVEI